MTALAADRNTQMRGAILRSYEIKAAVDILYVGAAAVLNSAGFAAPAQAGSGERFIGIVTERCDASGGSAGDKKVRVTMPISGRWGGEGFEQSDAGADCWFADDNVIMTTPGNVYAGFIEEVVSSTEVWVCHLPVPVTPGSWALGDGEFAVFGDESDLTMQWDAAKLEILPATDNVGSINIGNGTKDIDLKVFLSTSGKYVLADADAALLVLEDVDLHLGDNDKLEFGDASGGDVSFVWDTNSLNILPATDNTGVIEIGNGTADIDLKVFMGTTGKYVLADNDAALLILEDTDLHLGDADKLEFGDASGGDVAINWSGSALVMAAAAASSWLIGDDSYAINATLKGTLTVGKNDTGHDVQFFGASDGKSLLWDESEDKLVIVGSADLGTSCEADAYTVGTSAGVDFGPSAVASLTVKKGIVIAAA